MDYLTNEKLVIVSVDGMIGSNMVRTVLTLDLTPNICLYDVYEPGACDVFDGMKQCISPGANLPYIADPAEAFIGAKYIISPGGAPYRKGMTREDLLKGNCKTAADFNENTKKYRLNVKHVVVIFNPAGATALTVLIHSGLKPNQLTSLAALDSTRLRQALAHEFGAQQGKATSVHTYSGHGKQAAVFASRVKTDKKPLTEIDPPAEHWKEIKRHTVQGGSSIIKFHGHNSFQNPAYSAVKMIKAAMGSEKSTLLAGCYVNDEKFGLKNAIVATPITIDTTGVHYTEPTGTPKEMTSFQASYEHLCKMRDEVIGLDIISAVTEQKNDNANS